MFAGQSINETRTTLDPVTEIAGDPPVDDDDPRAEIARLEAHIEDLAEAMERCRKFILAARIAIAGGALWMVAATLGVIGFDPVALVGAIAAVIGGIVVFGSNQTTSHQIAADTKDAEAQRAQLISGLRLRLVGEGE